MLRAEARAKELRQVRHDAETGADTGGITPEEEAAFEALVAVFDEPAAEPQRPKDDTGAADPGASYRGVDLTLIRKPPTAGPAGPTTRSGPRDWSAADEADEAFVPPEPMPMPEVDTATKFAWVAVLGGPALLLFLAVFEPDELTGWPAVLGVLLFVGGFITLVTRMRDNDEDDDNDDGAVV
ncbi:hypothetical protein BIV57_17340 [Mangrovactinospora gilvigrisea]|uniref:Uncharacterized protein n=2 Tax=Mangrovactinospora gilvigrisea TaxID=1428644 RepID=A0A1J7C9D9_9ACTN|nr:hypothetical protein BIV57_17340 [Mangrovactinospora gilvigrisea]